jgi:hypothetical protein
MKRIKSNGLLHNVSGPAIIAEDGSECWCLNGIKHREGGPAVTTPQGDRYWYFNGVLHREDGPAIEYHDGTKYWYINGKKHRMDGPAVERASGRTQYWLFGVRLTQKVYDKFINEINNPNTVQSEHSDSEILEEKNNHAHQEFKEQPNNIKSTAIFEQVDTKITPVNETKVFTSGNSNQIDINKVPEIEASEFDSFLNDPEPNPVKTFFGMPIKDDKKDE